MIHRRIFDWLFPIRCDGKYRTHCYHRGTEDKVGSNPHCRDNPNPTYYLLFRECCRCGKRTGEHTF